MNKDEIDKKIDEAKRFEEEDKKVRALIEARNSAESLIYSAERSAEEYGSKVPKEVMDKVNSAKDALQEAIKAEDVDQIKAKSDDLSKALQEIGSSMYKGQPGQEAPGPGGSEGQGPDASEGAAPGDGEGGATDADFKVKK